MGGERVDGGLSKLLGVAQGLLGALAVGDVGAEADVAEELAAGGEARVGA